MSERCLDGNIGAMNFNEKLFFKINGLLGKNRFLDLFGKAGAEWVIIAMVGWYASGVLLETVEAQAMVLRLGTFPAALGLGWLLNIGIGSIVKEPRPHITHPESKLMFQPMMSWKSFPSDHAMSAWLIFFLGIMYNLPGAEALAVMALWVSWGRIYAGLHYPFDIVGGLSVAGLVAVAAYNVVVLIF